MRLWTIHSKYLDSKGLVALWREGLLAKKVLEGKNKGYKNHPQLNRFKNHKKPLEAINAYLFDVYKEAERRGYNFDKNKIKFSEINDKITVTSGQVEFEFKHLLNKLKNRDIEQYQKIKHTKNIEVNSIFIVVPGRIEEWERL